MRILVVEDEPSIANFVRQGLTEAGHAVDLAWNGRDGLDFALAADYDIFVLDIMLPKMNGLDLLRELRRRGDKTLTSYSSFLTKNNNDVTKTPPRYPSPLALDALVFTHVWDCFGVVFRVYLRPDLKLSGS